MCSSDLVIPEAARDTVIVAWPPKIELLEPLFKEAAERGLHWGVFVPVVYPITTDLATLASLAAHSEQHGARYFAAAAVDLDATAKQAIASEWALDGDDYATLFHSDLEPLAIATERHVGALAAEHGMADFVLPPQWPARSNWNAAILLTLTASRMIAIGRELELAGSLSRSARAVAELGKPIAWVAEAASLSIVGSLDEVSVDILGDWLESGRSAFVDRIDEEWRLRRDHFGAE